MIKLDISSAVSLYLLLSVVLLLLAWALMDRTKPDRLEVKNAFVWQCAICTFTYVDSRHDALSRCPRCGSLNERERINNKTGGDETA